MSHCATVRPFFSFLLLLLLALSFGACSSGEETMTITTVAGGRIDYSDSLWSSPADIPIDPSPSAVRARPDGATTTVDMAGVTVVNSKIADNAVTSPKIATAPFRDGQVMTVDLADIAVTNQKLGPSTITTDKLPEGDVMNPGVSADAVDRRVIANESIMAADIANGAITTTEVLNETIRIEDISANSVGTEEIVNEAILDADIANGAITATEVLNETILQEGVAGNGPGEEEIIDEDILPEPEQIVAPEPLVENGFRLVSGSPYSTFSIDVDNASYSNVRGYLSRGALPPPSAVRIEELVNYFDYNYPDPAGEHPFAFHSQVVRCPWNPEHRVVRLALQGKRIQPQQAAAANLVFLIDVSGSMADGDKLPLLKKSFLRFADELRPNDRVAVVVYAGAAGLVLESTPGSDRKKIREAIARLESGGSTAGGEGIRLAYRVARENYLHGGVNRVILATDGDFNVGVSSDDGLVKLIEEERKDGVFLSVLGFGTGNYQDTKMEKLADNGNGNYYYIDNAREGKRVLVDAMSGTLFAIAKDVKLQIKFNPEKVAAYRLIGYENRVLAAQDFDNDAKDAGELGAGHTVTALYEVVPVGAAIGFDPDTTGGEEYQLEESRPELMSGNDLLLARLRYKEPTDSVSRLIEHLVPDRPLEPGSADEATRFAVAAAQWGMLLRGSRYAGTGTYDDVLTQARAAMTHDPEGYRKEFVELVEKTKSLAATAEALGEVRSEK